MKRTILGLLVAMIPVAAQAKIVTQTVEYQEGGTTLEGFLAYDDAVKGKRPGVLVVHEWNGINDHTRQAARDLAALGYVALAADIYGKGVRPTDPKASGAEATKYRGGDRKNFRARLVAGLDQLKKDPRVDASKLGAIGFCFGGTGVIELARSGADLRGVVSFHGGLDSPAPADGKNIKARVLALHGADDPYVPAKDVEAFEKEMRDAKVDWQLVKYGGAVHSFTNQGAGNDPSKGAAYDERAARRAWEDMKQFFAETFRS
jgi:dienelactone hydrolase